MGYSWDNVIEDNIIEFSRWVGIAIEHGHGFVIRNNKIVTNGEGIRLFTRGGEVLKSWPGWEVSYDFTIEDNLFENNKIGFNGYTGKEIVGQDGSGYSLRKNTFRDNRTGVRLFRVGDSHLVDNTFESNVEQAVQLVGNPTITLIDNQFTQNAADVTEEQPS
jgi:parallel beta-helix repeat protein